MKADCPPGIRTLKNLDTRIQTGPGEFQIHSGTSSYNSVFYSMVDIKALSGHRPSGKCTGEGLILTQFQNTEMIRLQVLQPMWVMVFPLQEGRLLMIHREIL